jgi:hypothetical protein
MNTPKTPTITICSSTHFYKRVVEIQEILEAEGLGVIVPKTARQMKESGDFDVSHYQTWFANAEDYHKKADLMLTHFDEITKGDAILVVNEEKHGVTNYIGPNVLMEMSLAFYQKKPIFILNELPENSPFEEELKGMMPILLGGKVESLSKLYVETTA